MAVKKGTEKVPIDTLRVDAFSGGMNTSGDGRDIADNEALLIENLEFDELDNLLTRDRISQAFVRTTGSVTSIFSFNTETGFIGNLYTALTDLFSSTIGSPSAGGALNVLTGALVLPSGAKWYWKQLNNVAVGVNGSTGAGNPIQVVGPAPGTASHLAAAPDGSYIEEWGKRLWISHVANPNRIQCSNLGTATTWGTSGLTNPVEGIIIDVTPGDGDVITGLFAFKERLFIFKKKRIYVLRVTALPETDPNNWEIAEYSKILGCINQSTIREVFDDVVFLSEAGLASLSAAEIAADFSSAIISVKISEIQRIRKDASELNVLGFTLTDKSQYWLIVDSVAAPDGRNTIWVMDYKQIRTKGIRWCIFTGEIFPTAIDLYKGGGQSQQTYISAVNVSAGFHSICLYRPSTPVNQRIFRDKSVNSSIKPIISKIHTKAYDFGLDEIRKRMDQWFLRVRALTNKVNFKVSYEMDDPYEPVVTYNLPLYSFGFNSEKLLRQAFIHDVQRKSVHVSFKLISGSNLYDEGEGISIKNFGIRYGILNERKSEMLVTTRLKNVSVSIDRNRTVLGNVLGGADIVYNFLLPFGSLASDGDFIDIISGGGLAANNNDKGVILQVEGDPITGVGGDSVTGFTPLDFDGAAGFESWTIFARIMRVDAVTINITGKASVGQLFIDGAGAISVSNGILKSDNKNITVADLNSNDMTIQILATGVATNDIVHRQTTVQLNQQ